LGPGRGRCVSIFLLDKNKRHIGKFQSKQSPRRTQRPPHRCRVVRGIQRRQRRGVVELDALRQLRDRGGPRLRKVAQLVRVASQVEQPGVCVVRVWAALGASWHRGGHADGWRAARRDVVAVALSWSPQYQPAAAATMPSSPQVSSTGWHKCSCSWVADIIITPVTIICLLHVSDSDGGRPEGRLATIQRVDVVSARACKSYYAGPTPQNTNLAWGPQSGQARPAAGVILCSRDLEIDGTAARCEARCGCW
jgi:hypothetical protein